MQFVPQGSDAYRDERLVAVSDAEIARRLAAGRQDGAGWIASNEHWSPVSYTHLDVYKRQDKDYIYVDWYTNAWISGNQAFDMKVEENASTNQSAGAVLLGYRDSSSGTLYGVGDSDRTEQTLQKGTYVSPGSAFGGHAYVA